MLVTKTFYSVKCDKCGKMQTFDCEGNDCSESDAEADFEIDGDAALAVAESNGWCVNYEDNNKEYRDYCPECWEKIEEEMEAENDE